MIHILLGTKANYLIDDRKTPKSKLHSKDIIDVLMDRCIILNPITDIETAKNVIEKMEKKIK